MGCALVEDVISDADLRQDMKAKGRSLASRRLPLQFLACIRQTGYLGRALDGDFNADADLGQDGEVDRNSAALQHGSTLGEGPN